MEPAKILELFTTAEELKNVTRHCYTSGGRRESVAEHCWMAALLAFFMRDEFPEADMDKVIRMCLIHDLGEAFTGDIPTFQKTAADEADEEARLQQWVSRLPAPYAEEMSALYEEMAMLQTTEAKLYKAIDNLEAVIQHNHSDLSTWLPLEYELNQTYGNDKVAFSGYLTELRRLAREDTRQKIQTQEKDSQ